MKEGKGGSEKIFCREVGMIDYEGGFGRDLGCGKGEVFV